MKTRYYTATSINGCVADADRSVEWLLQFPDLEGVTAAYERFIAQVGALAMGSHTYEWLLEHEAIVEHPERWPYAQPTWVFSSRRLPAVPGVDIRFVHGDVRPVHAEMASVADGKDVWLVGGGGLVGQFVDAGLLDEVLLTIAPVMLAGGAPLLPRTLVHPPLRLLEVTRHEDIFVSLTYQVMREAPGSPVADV